MTYFFAAIFFSASTSSSPFLMTPAESSSSGLAAFTPLRIVAVFESSLSTRDEMSFGNAAATLVGSSGMPNYFACVETTSPES